MIDKARVMAEDSNRCYMADLCSQSVITWIGRLNDLVKYHSVPRALTCFAGGHAGGGVVVATRHTNPVVVPSKQV